mmetsp:Transcript_41167/g.109979  ORF Transcript_41167/g.109979 Transcript_41167/m.109979 type:complete len:200 (+) Transcript_41167:201-800(+)
MAQRRIQQLPRASEERTSASDDSRKFGLLREHGQESKGDLKTSTSNFTTTKRESCDFEIRAMTPIETVTYSSSQRESAQKRSLDLDIPGAQFVSQRTKMELQAKTRVRNCPQARIMYKPVEDFKRKVKNCIENEGMVRAQAHRIMRQQREAYEQRREQQYATSAYALVQYKSSDRPYITYAGLDAAAAGRTRRPDVTGA